MSALKLWDVTVEFPTVSTGISQLRLKQLISEGEGFLLVYSVTDRRSLVTVHQLLPYMQYVRRSRDLPVVLVGNKMDDVSRRCVGREEGRLLSFDLGTSFYESSSLGGSTGACCCSTSPHTRHYDNASLTASWSSGEGLASDSVTRLFRDLVRQVRCVRARLEYEREERMRQDHRLISGSGSAAALAFCGARGIVGRFSFRPKKRDRHDEPPLVKRKNSR